MGRQGRREERESSKWVKGGERETKYNRTMYIKCMYALRYTMQYVIYTYIHTLILAYMHTKGEREREGWVAKLHQRTLEIRCMTKEKDRFKMGRNGSKDIRN